MAARNQKETYLPSDRDSNRTLKIAETCTREMPEEIKNRYVR